MNNLPKVVTQRCLEQDLNPRPTDRKPKCLTLCTTTPPMCCTCIGTNLGGILEGRRADPEGLVGARGWVWEGVDPSAHKTLNFPLEMACFGDYSAAYGIITKSERLMQIGFITPVNKDYQIASRILLQCYNVVVAKICGLVPHRLPRDLRPFVLVYAGGSTTFLTIVYVKRRTTIV